MYQPCNHQLESLPDVFVDSGSSDLDGRASKAASSSSCADISFNSRVPSCDMDSDLSRSENVVLVPPNTPMIPETTGSSDMNDDTSSLCNTPKSRAVKLSRLSDELYAAFAPHHLVHRLLPAPSHVQPTGLIRLHNLGVEEYDRVENWRYYVNHEMVTNPSSMEPKLNAPNDEEYPSPVNNVFNRYSDSTWGKGSKRGKTANALVVRIPTPFELAGDASSEGDEPPSGMYSGNGHNIEPFWEAPKPKFLQRLFQSVTQQ